jgi:hypothetical protein
MVVDQEKIGSGYSCPSNGSVICFPKRAKRTKGYHMTAIPTDPRYRRA